MYHRGLKRVVLSFIFMSVRRRRITTAIVVKPLDGCVVVQSPAFKTYRHNCRYSVDEHIFINSTQ